MRQDSSRFFRISARPDLDHPHGREPRAAFDRELDKSEEIAARVLAASPHDTNALFAKSMASGLRGNYAAMIEKRNLAGLNYMKTGRVLALQVLALDPTYYDAYLGVGLENYLLGLSSAPVRWVLRMGGAQTNKEDGRGSSHWVDQSIMAMRAIAQTWESDTVAANITAAANVTNGADFIARRSARRRQPRFRQALPSFLVRKVPPATATSLRQAPH